MLNATHNMVFAQGMQRREEEEGEEEEEEEEEEEARGGGVGVVICLHVSSSHVVDTALTSSKFGLPAVNSISYHLIPHNPIETPYNRHLHENIRAGGGRAMQQSRHSHESHVPPTHR